MLTIKRNRDNTFQGPIVQVLDLQRTISHHNLQILFGQIRVEPPEHHVPNSYFDQLGLMDSIKGFSINMLPFLSSTKS